MPKLTLTLAGPVSMNDATGSDLTPSSMKARGLLTLVGAAAALRCPRAKLQDKLWSDRGPKQGNASLRQTLSEVRRALGRHRGALITGPGWVGLDPNLVRVDLDPDPTCLPENVEFAEDLDICDPEFDDWIRLQRQHHAARLSASRGAGPRPRTRPELAPLAITLAPRPSGHSGIDGFIGLALQDAALRACDLAHCNIRTGPKTDAAPGGLRLVAHAARLAGGFALNVTLLQAGSGQQLCSRTFTVGADIPAAELRQVSAEVTLALLLAVSRDDDAVPAAHPPLADVFSYSRDRLLAADARLDRSPPAAARLALRAYIRNTLLVERLAEDPEQTRAEATELAQRAVDRAPQSATALAVAAMTATRNRRFQLSAELALRAARIDPANPVARHSLAVALSSLGHHKEAHLEATRLLSEPLSALSPASWTMSGALTAARAGRLRAALRYADLAHEHAPDYRPPLRLLAALHRHLGQDAEAREAFRKLRTLDAAASPDPVPRRQACRGRRCAAELTCGPAGRLAAKSRHVHGALP